MLIGVSTQALAQATGSQGSSSATGSPSLSPSVLPFTGGAIGWFLGIAGVLIVLAWLVPLMYDARTSHRRSQEMLMSLLQDAAQGEGGLTMEELTTIAPLISLPVVGIRGLARALMALTILSIVGVMSFSILVWSGPGGGELVKQVVTGLLGVLGTVVGFYFGTRSAAEGNTAASQPPSKPSAPTPTRGQPGSPPPPSSGLGAEPPAAGPVRSAPKVSLSDPLASGELLILRGSVDPGGDTTYYRFEFGETIEYGEESPGEVGASGGPTSVLSGLIRADARFHYRLVAWNDVGITASDDRRWPEKAAA
jgi:hypothetical protein